MSVIIGVDPHKSTHTAVAVDDHEQVLDQIHITANTHQLEELLAWAHPYPDRRWAIEGANGLGRLLSKQLLGASEHVVDVPATLSARVRLLSGGSNRKTDPHDARAAAIAALHSDQLHQVCQEDLTVVLRMLYERRWHLSRSRNQVVNRIHVLLAHLHPGGARRELTAAQAGALLRKIRPSDAVEVERKQQVRELLVDLRRLDRQITDIDTRISDAVEASGTCLTDIPGVGPITAAGIIGLTGDIGRFPDRGHYASYAGVAPIEASSGDIKRHRLSRRGNRRLNAAIHLVAWSQSNHDCPGRDYYRRKLAEGKTRKEAMRALKRQITNVIWRHLVLDAERREHQQGPNT